MNKEENERITYEEFMIMFKNAPRFAYMLYDKAEDEIDRLNKVLKYLEKHFQEKEEYENAELIRQLKEANIEWLENALGDEE